MIRPMNSDVYQDIEGLRPCMKKPIAVHAKKMDKIFTVLSLEGVLRGNPGDYVMKGIDGELYICDGDIFERSYDWVKEK